ncbi:MAG: hypothetical protein HXY20_11355 [Acidobacteria bacterium]|nr:hypothetical protein [Acidobacteriota bacterium]
MSRSRFALAVVASLSAGALLSPPPVLSAENRAFRMGFTPFVFDMTLEAVAETDKFIGENGDIVAQHMESVPWSEALSGAPLHPEFMKDWERRKKMARPGMAVYVAVSPLDMGRAKIAAYRGEKEGMPLPPQFEGKELDDDLVKRAYLAYCRRAVEYFKPEFLGIGIEVNELFHNSPGKWPSYVALHKYVYEALKKDHPALMVFSSFTLHNMVNPGWKDRAEMLEAYKGLMPYNDLVALSFYPFMCGISNPSKLDEPLAWLTANFDSLGKPYAVAETGEATENITLKTGAAEVTIYGSLELQKAYYEKLLELAQEKKFKFVVSFLHRDYDALWEKIKSASPSFFIAWRDCGLLDENGQKRPAYEVWRRFLAMPLAR